MEAKSINLVIGFPGWAAHPLKYAEYDLCLRKNINNPKIDFVHIIEEEPTGNRKTGEFLCPKVSVTKVGKRANFDDYIRVANETIGVALIANADVWFDWSVAKLAYTPPMTLMAITRTDAFSNFYSSDAWAFIPKLPATGCDFPPGRTHCEHALCDKVESLGWALMNPCHDIKVKHEHSMGMDAWSPDHEVRVGRLVFPLPTLVYLEGQEFLPMPSRDVIAPPRHHPVSQP